MKKIIYILLLVLSLFTLLACSSKGGAEGGRSYDYYSKSDGMGGIIPGGEDGEGEGQGFQDEFEIPAGQLTASALFDNDEYDFFQSLLTKGQTETGIFYEYQQEFKFNQNRIALTFKGATNLKVSLYNGNDLEYTAYTSPEGKVYLFNSELRDEYNIKVSYKDSSDTTKTLDYVVKNNDEITIEDTSVRSTDIQIMFIVDTTGSMGDEIDYLKAELKDVITKVKENNSCNVYVALMFYRDTTDEYTTKYFDFTADIDAQVKNLSDQYASGGGDFEEAVQSAFSLADSKQWYEQAGTKIIVHVADAPSHDADVKSWFTSVKSLASKGVRIIMTSGSGIDDKTEFFFREECIYTNGCYAFLTDDSGIGGSHKEARIKEALEVEYLNDLLIRVINGMHTGTYEAPINYKQK